MESHNFESPEALLCYAKNIFQKRRIASKGLALKYHPEEQALAVQLLNKGFRAKQLVKELEIGFSTLNYWNAKLKKNPFQRPAPRILKVVSTTPENTMHINSCPVKNNNCKIKINHHLSIFVDVTLINATLLTEIIKAVNLC